MRKKIAIISLGILFLLAVIGSLYVQSATALSEPQSLVTKAICTPQNYCEDYEIACKGEEVVKITPTGAAVQFSEDWEDPRTQEDRKIACD